jgi:enterobactin synthetase component D
MIDAEGAAALHAVANARPVRRDGLARWYLATRAAWPTPPAGAFVAAPHPIAPGAVALGLRFADVAPLLAAIAGTGPPPGVARRRLDGFVAGRLCAGQALRRLGIAEAVAAGEAGQPLWPAGITGSITHTADVAYAAVRPGHVALDHDHDLDLGIDSEPVAAGEAREAIERLCLTPHERDALLGGVVGALDATVLFCAKEALYKAIHRRVRRYVDFTEVQAVAVDRARGEVHLRACDPAGAGAGIPSATVRYVVVDGVVHAAVDCTRHPAGDPADPSDPTPLPRASRPPW